ncbi:MAG: histidine decarboxylase, pyruvoyl type [Patescibacteria group bacterium]
MKRINIEELVGSHQEFLEGYWPQGQQSNYLFGLNIAVAKVKNKLSHKGSSLLDMINAFDLAEVAEGHLGQTNMVTVSSFCGPNGLIWGLDVCKTELRKHTLFPNKLKQGADYIGVHNADGLMKAFASLTGGVDDPLFCFQPGSHVLSAAKSYYANGPKKIYAALALGIPKDRTQNACLLMEDVGFLPRRNTTKLERKVLDNLVHSVLAVGLNQRVQYSDIFIGLKTLDVNKGETGCALVSAPYFLLPKALLNTKSEVLEMSLEEWEKFSEKYKVNN